MGVFVHEGHRRRLISCLTTIPGLHKRPYGCPAVIPHCVDAFTYVVCNSKFSYGHLANKIFQGGKIKMLTSPCGSNADFDSQNVGVEGKGT
jgi:hypothetical protein